MPDGSLVNTDDRLLEPADAPSSAYGTSERLRGFLREPVFVGATILVVMVIALIGLFPLGVGGDYPEHLARSFIVSKLNADPVLSAYYHVDLAFIPRLAMDAIVAPLSVLVGPYAAGAIFAALAMVSAPLAGVRLSRRMNGAAAGWLPLIGFIGMFSLNLEFGFLDFMVATGLSIVLFDEWMRDRQGVRSRVVFAIAAFVLAIGHALAFLFLGYLVLVWELANLSTHKRGTVFQFIRRQISITAPSLFPGLILIFVSSISADRLDSVDVPFSITAQRHLALMSAFRFHVGADAVMASIASLLAFVVGLAVGFRCGALRMSREWAILCSAVLLLIAFMPTGITGVWGLHLRFAPAFIVLLSAGLCFSETKKPSVSKLSGGGLGLLFAVVGLQFYNGVQHFHTTDASFERLRRLTTDLPEGARILKVASDKARLRLAEHGPALAVIETKAYNPTVFTQTSLVSVTSDMRSMHLPFGQPLTVDQVAEAARKPIVGDHNGYWSKEYYYGWPDRFTHLIIGHRRGETLQTVLPPQLQGQLCTVGSSIDWTIASVRPSGQGC